MSTSKPRQQTNSHTMKTTHRGRPFLKDTHDLYATLIVSLNLGVHRQFFKSYPNSFTTDEAASNLSQLKFAQSNRTPDPRDPTRIITTTTTTTFSMNREMAKGVCQIFMDARLIENAADPSSGVFKDRGVYMLTPKGLHVLERFITKNGISADHLMKVFATQPICMKLLHLERRASDDEILITRPVIEVIFRRFVGRQANYLHQSSTASSSASTSSATGPSAGRNSGTNLDFDRTLGVEMNELPAASVVPPKGVAAPAPGTSVKHTFAAIAALDWLTDFTTIIGRDEAAEVAAHFVRYGLIELLMDRSRKEDSSMIVTVKASGASGGAAEAEFRCTSKAVYRVTDEGRRVARWDRAPAATASTSASASASASARPVTGSSEARASSDSLGERSYGPGGKSSSGSDPKLSRRTSMAERLRAEYLTSSGDVTTGAAANAAAHHKESNTGRLKQILDEPALRSLFREFLRGNFCEENLSFWLDVQDFKRRFGTTSSAVASGSGGTSGARSGKTYGATAMEKHQQELIAMAFVIYNTYLAPASPCELNIDHNLRAELVDYMSKIREEAKEKHGPDITAQTVDGVVPLHASQLQTMVKLYERIQAYIFRLMATDSVPKFIKTERFLALMKSVDEYADAVAAERDAEAAAAAGGVSPVPSTPVVPSGGDKAHLNVSLAASAKQSGSS